jgi:hypothetical protein
MFLVVILVVVQVVSICCMDCTTMKRKLQYWMPWRRPCCGDMVVEQSAIPDFHVTSADAAAISISHNNNENQ